MEQEKEKISDLRKKHEYTNVDKTCPICGNYPLEEQTFGHEKSVFCVGCDYQYTIEL